MTMRHSASTSVALKREEFLLKELSCSGQIMILLAANLVGDYWLRPWNLDKIQSELISDSVSVGAQICNKIGPRERTIFPRVLGIHELVGAGNADISIWIESVYH